MHEIHEPKRFASLRQLLLTLFFSFQFFSFQHRIIVSDFIYKNIRNNICLIRIFNNLFNSLKKIVYYIIPKFYISTSFCKITEQVLILFCEDKFICFIWIVIRSSLNKYITSIFLLTDINIRETIDSIRIFSPIYFTITVFIISPRIL